MNSHYGEQPFFLLFLDAWVFNRAREGVSRIFGKEASSEPHRTLKQRQPNLAKKIYDIRELIWVFVQRGDFVVSVVAELPANRGTYTVYSRDILLRWLGASTRAFRWFRLRIR